MAAEQIRILIVDDIDETRENLAKLIGFEIDMEIVGSASSGQQAIDLAKRERPHVILMDINMPRIDGIEALRQIKASPETHRVPVIMLTTTDDPREIDRCYELGCNVYITKPVEYDGFIDAIRRLGLFLQIVQRPRNGKN